MLSRTEAAKLFEKHIDDVFDFESLESCESVYGGSDLMGYSNPECISPLVVEEVVFNTSATSQPFADTSTGGGIEVTHLINHERIIGKDETTFSKDARGLSTNQRVELASKGDGEGSRLHLLPISHDNKPFTPIQQFSTHHHPQKVTQHEINNDEDDILFNSNDENSDLNKTYTLNKRSDEHALKMTPATSALQNATCESSVSMTDTSTTVNNVCNDDRHSTVTRDSEEYAFTQQCNEPVSMDLFGLPVRWTDIHDKKSHQQHSKSQDDIKTVQSYSGKIKKLSKTHIEPLPDNDYVNLDDDNDNKKCNMSENDNKYSQGKIKEDFASGQEKEDKDDDSRVNDDENMTGVMSEYDKPSEGDFTFTSSHSSTLASSSETSGEACHYQATTGNLLQTSTCHHELSAISDVVDDGFDRNAQDESPSLPKENQHANRAAMRDLQISSNPHTVPGMSHPTHQSVLIKDAVNESQQIHVGQPQYVKTQRNHDDFSSRYYKGDLKNDNDAICQQRPSIITHSTRGGQYQTDFPSGDSDTDTDNTDGDYDEEDHFAAELSLRISTVQSEVNSGLRSFRNSDILNVLTVTGEEEGAGLEDATDNLSPLASQEGSSPEMPDSLRSSEGKCGTRSIETLSEDSGLGDRDVRLTPSSPLPSISESNTRASAQVIQQSLASVTARPRRQDIRQAHIAKARSCGDLRAFSDSDTDTEDCDMHAWHSRSRSGTATSGGNGILEKDSMDAKYYKSSYANYLQQQYHGQEDGSNGYRGIRNGSSHPVPSPPHQHHYNSHYHSHPISGSDGSDEEVRSRYRRHKDASSAHSKPRRHKSLLEFPWLDGNYNTSQNSEFLHKDSERTSRGVGENGMMVSGKSRFSRRRPQPISVDLAEEFISQEGLESLKSKAKDKVKSERVKKGDERSWVTHLSPIASEKGGVSQDASCRLQTNQEVCSEVKTNGGKGGGVMRQSSGSWGDEEGLASACEDEVRADMRVQSGWPRAPTAPYPHLHPLDTLHQHHHPTPSPKLPPSSVRQPHHQYSSTPAQLPDECQPVHIGHSGNSVPHVPLNHSNPSKETTQQPLKQPQLSSSKEPTSTTEENDMAEVPVRVRTKTYGSHGEVEVYLARADTGRPPPPTVSSPVLTPTGGTVDQRITGFRGVTFAPSVKEVNWRESYYEVDPDSDENKSDKQTVNVVSDENNPAKAVKTQKANETVVESVMNKQRDPIRPAPVIPMPIMQPQQTGTRKHNGSGMEQPTGSSSEHDSNEEKSQQKGSGPIWQRFKLPKISSPKSPRPKLLPKPKSLSPRSSDTESSKPSSPTPESESSTPSSPDNKLKKTPPSPKFFTWGSKREKKVREITRPTTAPPPIPQPVQVSGGQVGLVVAKGGGVPGKPESSSVTLTDLNREGIASSPNVISVKKHEVITSDSSEDSGVRSELIKKHIRESEAAVTNSISYNSGKEEDEVVDRYSHSVSSSGEDSNDTKASSTSSSSSPRGAVAKPPLPPHLQRPTQQAFHKARLLSARRHYFSQERQVSAPERVSPPKDTKDITDAQDTLDAAVVTSIHSRPHAITATTTPITSLPPPKKFNVSPSNGFDSSRCLKERFEKFSASTRADRERLARSTPDLSVIEASVRRPNPRIDSWTRGVEQNQQQQADIHLSTSPASASDGEASHPTNAHKGAPHTQKNPRQAIHERYKNRAQRIYARTRTQSVGVLETDLDTGASREFLTLRETNLDDLYKDLQHLLDTLPSVGGPTPTDAKARAKSLLDLEAAGSAMEGQLEAPTRPPDNRAKSMEFLLDDGNKAAVQPPENELMKGSERQLSEAELRVRRSLQRLDVPDWMKNAQPPQQGFLLRRRDYGSSSMAGGGWSAYSSKTASMTSLGSSRAHTPNTPTKVVIPTRVASKGTTGLGGVTSPASNASISPSPSDRSGSLFQYPISRWSTSRLNSGTTTPTGSVTSTRTTPATYVRQPYLGWRSQTSLASLAGSQSSLTNTGSYLTAADRLALGITAYSQRFVKSSVSAQDKENSSAQANSVASKSDNEEMTDDATTNGDVKLKVPADVADVHSSIKEVTSAIVHYCNESTPSPKASPRGSPRPEGPRAPSPRRLVWVESSFVGSRPITSPETPTSSTHAITPTSQLNGHEEPESNEAPSQPPQPPGEYLLAW